MKKSTVIILVVIVLAIILCSTLFLFNVKNEIKDTETINQIVNDSNLEILLNLKDFDKENFSESNLLEVSMLLASELGYKNETSEGDYVEYVNPSELHEIIKDLTGIEVEAPIQVDDSLYRYDSENEYYYFIPFGDMSLYQISQINHVYRNDNIYTIECTASKTEDGEISAEHNIITELEYLEDNSYTNYRVISQKVS